MTRRISGAGLRRQVIFWLLFAAFVALFLYVFRSILLPFVAGMALAYFLDPVADRLEKIGMNRLWATTTIMLTFLIVVIAVLLLIIPLLVSQASEVVQQFPKYIAALEHYVQTTQLSKLVDWANGQLTDLSENVGKMLSSGASIAGSLFGSIWSSSMAVVNVVSFVVLAPVIAFYLLLDWDRMVAKVDQWIPRGQVDDVRYLAREINSVISGFVRGQGSLCLILGVYYAVALSLAGLNFGALIGLFAGFISFIPYLGSTSGLVLSMGVAMFQFWPDFWMIALVFGIYLFGQFLEGNVLQPKLVGGSVRLHPVWLMFALFAFSVLFGFVGLLVAVPVAAAVGVLVRFAIDRYLTSDLYWDGIEHHADEPTPVKEEEG
ncbi:AI-2E family transporter [Martelella lutilitoris]|uniref:AI-2E family transporter n=1 Tax=Martelella lutilitoris TaxID=2583532 RepID=A0A7T7HIP2_9HYPH|nr:AI-2E family transporter [Martelella lutilitoris]QQM29862.1 AI-2E family transporter [Martelella lutilitoris]